jgi:hypothetical protein
MWAVDEKRSRTQARRTVDEGLANVAGVEHGRRLKVVPVCIGARRQLEMRRTVARVAAWGDGSSLPLRVKGSTTRFLMPFFPFERRLFLPTAARRRGCSG